MQRHIGASRITSIREHDLTDIELLLYASTPEEIRSISWLRPHFADEHGSLLGVVQAFVLEHAGRLIVIDPCVGNDKDLPVRAQWSDQETDFLELFAAAGFDVAAVDMVLCTHLHLDHVGWNTYHDGERWQPTFPNARYLFDRTEYEFWNREATSTYVPAAGHSEQLATALGVFHATQANVQRDSVQPIIDAGLADLVEAPCQVLPGLELVPTPGHTPGHVAVMIESDGERALITGDSFHHPSQIARPEWAASPDSDQAASTATRRRILSELAGTDTLVIGTHFVEPVCGHIVHDDDTYRLAVLSG